MEKKRGNGHEREQEVELQPLPSLGLEGGRFGQVIEKVGASDVWWGLVLPLALLSRTVRRESFLLLGGRRENRELNTPREGLRAAVLWKQGKTQ